MKRTIVLLTVFALIGSIGLFLPNLFAFHGSMKDGKWWYRPGVKDALQLTPDQINRINTIWVEHQKVIIDIRSDVRKTYLDLEDMMSRPVIDQQKAYTLAGRLSQLQAQETEKRIKMAIDIRRELSVEQYEKLKGLRREFVSRHREKGHPSGKRGGPRLD
jgi:Spy/CpxP family protein refolding chaperone